MVKVRDIRASSSGVIDGFQISGAKVLAFTLGLRRMLSLRALSGGSVGDRADFGMASGSSYMGEDLERSKNDLSVSKIDGGLYEPIEVMDPARVLPGLRREGTSSMGAGDSSRS
ncbi:hypothetical protein PAXRUDRAFT_135963 [Paxillus rubicundulus Ve08.2h10]|uniref:Uncharacterized protein n=1 Tax=Paxillus rubicundulus Ve08.2h10 TaxID=930991 RepID=A0A0D0E7C9_9AGAM|nr:hypothetical protein PAXRUDRAFT_135963 [Paxillus rubicundulus Ve08.2h10]